MVAASDYLNFARRVFLAAFIMVLGGAALAASLAFGLGGRDAVRRHLEDKTPSGDEQPERAEGHRGALSGRSPSRRFRIRARASGCQRVGM